MRPLLVPLIALIILIPSLSLLSPSALPSPALVAALGNAYLFSRSHNPIAPRIGLLSLAFVQYAQARRSVSPSSVPYVTSHYAEINTVRGVYHFIPLTSLKADPSKAGKKGVRSFQTSEGYVTEITVTGTTGEDLSTSTTAATTTAEATTSATVTSSASTTAATTAAASTSATTTSDASTNAASTSMVASTNAVDASTNAAVTTTSAASDAAATTASVSAVAAASTSTASTFAASTSDVATVQASTTTASTASITTMQVSTAAVVTNDASTTAAITSNVASTELATTIAALLEATAAASYSTTVTYAASTTGVTSATAAASASASTSAASTTTVSASTTTTNSASSNAVSTSAVSTSAAASTAAVSTSASSTTVATSTAASTTAAAVTTTTAASSSTVAQATALASTSALSTTADTTTVAITTSTVSGSTEAATTTSAATTTAYAATVSSSTSVDASTTVSTTQATATRTVSTTIATLSVSLSGIGAFSITGSSAPPNTLPVPPSANAFYYNASLFSIQTEQTAAASASYLPLVRRDLAVVVLQSGGVPLYIRPEQCLLGNCCVNAGDVAPCCSSAPSDPDCVANSTGMQCLDTSAPLSGNASFSSSVFYEIGIAGSCQNLLVELDVVSGDADLYAQANNIPDALYERTPYNSARKVWDWSSTNLGSDSIYFCCNGEDGNTPTPYGGATMGSVDSSKRTMRRTLSTMLPQNGSGRLYVQVVSWSAQARWRLRLLPANESDPRPLLPLRDFPWMLSRTKFTCGNTLPCYPSSTGDVSSYACLMLAVPSLDPVDPYYEWASRASSGAGFTLADLLPDQVSFVLQLSVASAGQTLPPLLLENCTISAPGILDVNGNPLFSDSIPVLPAPLLACSPADFHSVAGVFLDFSRSSGTPSSAQRSDIVQRVSAVVTSRAWAACSAYANGFLTSNLTDDGTSSTICLEERGTAAYLADPCCNPLLLLHQCCAPRPGTLHYLTNDSLVTASCASESCSVEAVNQLGKYLEIQSDPQVGCDAQALQATRNFRATNPLLIPSGVCSKYLTWAASAPSPYDPALTECVLTALKAAPFLQRAFAQLVLNITDIDFVTEFDLRFRARYAQASICQQGGAPFNRDSTQLRDASLDSDSATCLSTPTCNWGLDRTSASCLGEGYRSNGSFCGYCVNDYCYEVSDQKGCRIPRDYWSGNLAEHCDTLGGVMMYEEQTARNNQCFLPDALTQGTCFNNSMCRSVSYTTSPNVATCKAGCALAGFNATTCGCTTIPSDPVLANECNYLKWDSTTARCWHDGVNNANDCAARNGAFLGGQIWHAGYHETPTTCGGVCLEDPTITSEAACVGVCDKICPGCDNATCISTEGCNDLLSLPIYGACISTPTLSPLGLVPSCSSSGYITPIGCADYYLTQSLCKAQNLTWYVPQTNLSYCGEPHGCAEDREGFPIANSFRAVNDCLACGGIPYSAFSLVNGSFTAYHWQNLTWIERKYEPIAKYGPAFNTLVFNSDWETVSGALEFSALKSQLLCEYAQPASLLSDLSCDCLGGRNCYSTQGAFVGLFKACSGIEANFSAASGVTLTVPVTASFVRTCTEIELYQIPIEGLKAPPTIRSSLFLASLNKGRYAIVRNKKGVQIGQLAGPGVQLQMDDADGIRLCLPLDRPGKMERDFTIPDFARADSSLSRSSFHALLLTTAEYIAETDSICAVMVPPLTGFYFPIYRSAKPGHNYFQALSGSQRAAFYAALVIYLIMTVIAYYRVGTALLYSLMVSRIVTLVAIWAMVSLILTLRWIYFAIVIASNVSEGSASDYVLSELPTTLFFTLFSLIVLFWAMLYHAFVAENGDFRKPMIITAIVVNTLLYIFLIAVIAVYVRDSGDSSRSVCGKSTASVVAPRLVKAYKIILSIIVLVLAIAFVVYGVQLARVLSNMKRSSETQSKFIKFVLTAIIFPLGLVLQCVLLLYGTFGKPVSTGASLVLLILVEIVPIALLTYTMALPKVFDSPLKDFLWFLYCSEISASGSTGAAGSGNTSRKPHVISDDRSMVDSVSRGL